MMLCLGKPFLLALLFIGIDFAHQRPKFASNSDLKCGITFYNDTESGHHRAKRVNHGDPAYEGQWPWMATLVYRDGYQPYDAPSIILCSATIISEEYILSAGHCFINAEMPFTETFQVAVGAVDVVTGEPIRVDIAAAFRHPYYAETATSLKNDILVLKLAKPLVLSDTVQPICLASNFDGDDVTNPEDESALVAGWGLESHYGPTTDTLLYGHMYFVDIMTCALNHRFIEINKNNHICAAGKWQNTEQGDSGGPIFVKSALKDEIGRHRYVEVGICSFDWNPDVFARVSPYCDFIKKTTNGSVNCVNL